ncbi:MAG: OmpA family protein, partial [Runella slithyformis]
QGYLIEVEAFNYDKFLTKIELSDNPSPADLRREIKLIKKTANAKAKAAFVNDQVFENAKLGEAVTIEDNVYFDQSSYILRPEAHSQLNQLVVLMAKNTKLKVQIAGFTDNVGDPRLNLILSENRAKVIANYLVYKGITESRITHLGYGQTKPITPNDTEDNKRKNRRVEFIIKDN